MFRPPELSAEGHPAWQDPEHYVNCVVVVAPGCDQGRRMAASYPDKGILDVARRGLYEVGEGPVG